MYEKVSTTLDFVEREKKTLEFWKENKKRVGEVCEKCRNEIDCESALRSRKRKHGEWR